MWERDHRHHSALAAHSDTTSESGLSDASSSCSGGTASTRVAAVATATNGTEVNTPRGRRILGNPTGPTIITVSGQLPAVHGSNVGSPVVMLTPAMAAQHYESMLYHSMDEPVDHSVRSRSGGDSHHHHHAAAAPAAAPSAAAPAGVGSGVVLGGGNLLFDEAADLEPIDFEHFVDEPEIGRNQSERMFQVTLGSSPPMRGR